LGRESDPAFMRRYQELTPALPAAMANPGVKVLTTRTVMPLSDTQLERTEFYREIMRPEGWRHAVALCFWNDPPAEAPIFVSTVYRHEGRCDFAAEEVASLEGIHPFLDCSVSRVYEREAAATVRDGMAMAVHDGARGFALLDRNLRMVQANLLGRQLYAAWINEGIATDTESPINGVVPPELQTACRELRHEWRSRLRDDPDATGIRRRPGLHPLLPGLTARIS